MCEDTSNETTHVLSKAGCFHNQSECRNLFLHFLPLKYHQNGLNQQSHFSPPRSPVSARSSMGISRTRAASHRCSGRSILRPTASRALRHTLSSTTSSCG